MDASKKLSVLFFTKGTEFTYNNETFTIGDAYETHIDGKFYWVYKNGEKYKMKTEIELINVIPDKISRQALNQINNVHRRRTRR